MIDLYTWITPNGRKISIMLEETGLPYEVHPVNLGKDEQFQPEFLTISPNNKIPAIVDRDGPGGKPYSLFESGAILMYLAEKSGRLMPKDAGPRYQVVQWLMFQMGGVGPMIGQAHYFLRHSPEHMDRRLGESPFLAGEYSIADIATYPWIARYEAHRTRLEDFPNVKRWYDAVGARPAVQRGMAVPPG